MTTGTIIMIVCAVLFLLLGIFFKKDLDEMDKGCSSNEDPYSKGSDWVSGVPGQFSDDVGVFKKNR